MQKESDHCRNCVVSDSWFASVKTAEAMHECGHEWIGIIKTSHSLYPKKEMEQQMKTWPGGMSLVMGATTSEGVKLIAVGYKYNSSKVLCFVATKNTGSTLPGEPYQARFIDDFQNLLSRPVDQPQIISKYFLRSSGKDKHNQARQFELRLEKHWRTQNAWFRLVTTMIGICVTDCWKGYKYAFRGSKYDEEITIRDFSDRLAYELLHNNFTASEPAAAKILSPLIYPDRRSPGILQKHQDATNSSIGVTKGNLVVEITEATVSPLTKSSKVHPDMMWLKMMELHQHVQQDSTEATRRKIRWHCNYCKFKTGWYCETCKYIAA